MSLPLFAVKVIYELNLTNIIHTQMNIYAKSANEKKKKRKEEKNEQVKPTNEL